MWSAVFTQWSHRYNSNQPCNGYWAFNFIFIYAVIANQWLSIIVHFEWVFLWLSLRSEFFIIMSIVQETSFNPSNFRIKPFFSFSFMSNAFFQWLSCLVYLCSFWMRVSMAFCYMWKFFVSMSKSKKHILILQILR